MTAQPTPRRVWHGQWSDAPRTLPAERPVALSYNGTTQAVMMATPADLEDFGRGFSLTEGIAGPEEILEIAVTPLHEGTAAGIDVQMTLAAGAETRLAARRRAMAGPVGCGLCGLDSIAAALRSPPPVPPSPLTLAPDQVTAAMAALPAAQALHTATRAAHAAALWSPTAGLIALREDVGRHNALDKLAGAALAAGTEATACAVVLTSRVSIDMVQKVGALGAPILIAASAPTAQAVDLAEGAGLTLIGLTRQDRFELFTHPQRITPQSSPEGATAHVA